MTELKQNTDKWLEWRREGLGSSDAPVIMGVSPYKTSFQLWEEKLGLGEVKVNAYITQKGHDLEPKIRARYELQCDASFDPELAKSTRYDFLRASLDGINHALTRIIEIKYMGVKNFNKVVSELKPLDHHYPQLQHALMVTGYPELHYIAYNDEIDDIKTIVVKPDLLYMQGYYVRAKEFWQKVLDKKPPEFEPKDWRKVNNILLQRHITEYRRALKQRKYWDEKVNDAKTIVFSELERITTHPRVETKYAKIVTITKKGNVDYKKVPELKGVNLEGYRKPSSVYKRIDVL